MRKELKSNALLLLALAMIPIAIAAVILFVARLHVVRLREWLTGQRPANITSIEFDGGEHYEISDPPSMKYFSQLIRGPQRDDFGGGISYHAKFSLDIGETVECDVFIGENLFSIASLNPDCLTCDPQYFQYELNKPIPIALSKLLESLTAPEDQQK